ncbi:MAG TPA: NAD(P)/FAD-dependent oxidoreductase [Thermoanaerobaculaceae bacterium]|nr:NAD(P)/FAD-dependent oxidoreductase [Thermoanaerobaculaceae bacterium]HRS14827.1 NAD(P)/FAD-dependent oxidoreductase [Thermoanaerobaculaceae bacterium]
MAESDLVVVGGGPAGLATAVHARLAGMRVTVLDGQGPVIDRACGEGLMPAGRDELDGLGVKLDPVWTAPFAGIRYCEEDDAADGRFPCGCGLGVRRTALHAALAARAEALGVDVRWGVGARGLSERGVETERGVVRAAYVVGADGRASAVRRWAGLEHRPGARGRAGVRRHYTIEPWSEFVEVYWAAGAEAYVTPVGPQQVGVAILWSGGASTFDALLPRFPGLQARLSGAPVASRDMGGAGFGAVPRTVATHRVALVGDAAGSVDPITGVGVTLALRQARALVAALVAGRPRAYVAAHRRIMRPSRVLACLLLLLTRHHRLRRGAIRALEADPGIFGRLVGLNAGQLPARSLGAGSVLLLLRTLRHARALRHAG